MDGTEPGNVNYKETTGRFIQTSDGNFLISGYTESPDNGDVTGYHPNPNIFDTARADLWIVSLSASGNLSWQRTYGGTKGDWPRGAPVEVNPNEFIITAFTNSNDYDITGANGSYDAWILKLGAINTIKGTLFVDYNLNGSKDLNEPYYSDAIVKSKKATDSISSIPYGGLFVNEVDTGNYITIPMVNQPYYTIVPSSASSNFTSYFNKDSFNFALQPIANKQDVVISIVPLSSPRPGFSSSFRLFYKNEGTTTIASGEVLFKKDARTTVLYTSSSVNSANGDTLKWNYTNFAPGDTASIIVNLQVSSPPTVNNGDTLFLKAIITPVTGDETPSNDTAILKQRVVGSFDPNDKIENNGGVVSSSFIANGDYLQYTVRFQNTGTAEAYFVTVRDTLGNRVDLNTLEVITASHPYTLSIENGNQLIWQFHNIMLPASSLDELGSHGYIVYRIRPKADVAVGETIHNTASIYFDYNLPVLTNDATTFVQDNSVVLPIQLTSFTGQLTNNTVQLNWKADEGRNFEKFEIERSLDGKVYNRIETVSFNNSINDYHVLDNIAVVQSKLIFYRLKMIDADGKFIYSRVVAFKLNSLQNNFTVYPNPARTEVFISMSANKAENLQVKVLDASGRVVSELRKQIQKGTNVFSLSTSKLRAANYVLQFVLNGETKISKLTIIN